MVSPSNLQKGNHGNYLKHHNLEYEQIMVIIYWSTAVLVYNSMHSLAMIVLWTVNKLSGLPVLLRIKILNIKKPNCKTTIQ